MICASTLCWLRRAVCLAISWRHSTPVPKSGSSKRVQRIPLMKLNVAVQMDPIARINIRGDSTFALLLEAQKRGHGLSYYTPDKLSQVGDDIVAPVQLLTVRDEPGNHFSLGEPKRASLRSFDVVLLRQDPPFDLAYITSTHMLERIHPKTLVVNDPASVR